MIQKATMISRVTFGAIATLALSACSQSAEQPTPEPEPTALETPDTDTTEPVSIIREDADIERGVDSLEPLHARISFDEGGSDLSEVALTELAAVLETRQFKAGGAIVLRGHTDSAGADAANLRSAQRRADAVRDWLIEKGVAETRITTVAIGEQNPGRPNAKPDGTPDEEGRAFNRRVDVGIAIPAELTAVEDAPTLIEKVSAED